MYQLHVELFRNLVWDKLIGSLFLPFAIIFLSPLLFFVTSSQVRGHPIPQSRPLTLSPGGPRRGWSTGVHAHSFPPLPALDTWI